MVVKSGANFHLTKCKQNTPFKHQTDSKSDWISSPQLSKFLRIALRKPRGSQLFTSGMLRFLCGPESKIGFWNCKLHLIPPPARLEIRSLLDLSSRPDTPPSFHSQPRFPTNTSPSRTPADFQTSQTTQQEFASAKRMDLADV